MSRDSRKKERQRLKRKQKKLAMRRERSRTTLQRIGAEGGTLECWINSTWRESGMASVMVLGRSHGRFACCSFLIDIWCVGLKDAGGRADVGELEFREDVLAPYMEQLEGTRIDTEVACRLVAGAIRFARQNGFRLPPHWERWVSIFGRRLGDLNTADLSDFGVDGRIRYVGDADFLRKRLIACPPEEFMARKDVELVLNEPGPGNYTGFADEDEDEGEEDEADEDSDDELAEEEEMAELMSGLLDQMSDRVVDATRQWCFANNIVPNPRLKEGAALVLATTLPITASVDPGQDVEEVDASAAGEIAEAMLSRFPESDLDEIRAASDQIRQYFTQFKSPEEAVNALHLENLE